MKTERELKWMLEVLVFYIHCGPYASYLAARARCYRRGKSRRARDDRFCIMQQLVMTSADGRE